LTLLAIINSKLLSWYFLLRSSIANRDDFPKIVLRETRALPIPPSAHDEPQLRELAETCQEAAQTGDKARLRTLEAQVDQIVYRLFELTPEESALIENSTSGN